MAANKRAGRVGIWACSRSCTAIWMRVKQAEAHVFYAILKISCHQQARRSEVLGDNLSARYIHNNHKLALLRQCDYYGLRSQNITKYFCELLQEVDDRISFYCCLYRCQWLQWRMLVLLSDIFYKFHLFSIISVMVLSRT